MTKNILYLLKLKFRKMKKLLLNLLLILFAVNVGLSQTNIVKLSGIITNPNGDEALIKNDSGFVKYFELDKKGKFKDTLSIPKNGFYTFSDGRETSTIYLENGFNIKLSVNTEEFDETINYEGIGSDCNNFLAQKYMINELNFADYSIYNLDEKEFLHKQDSINDLFSKMLDKVDNTNFVVFQKKEINYNYLISLKNYEPYHQYFSKDMAFKASDKISKIVADIDFTNAEDYELFDTYKALVNTYYLNDISDLDKIEPALLAIKSIKDNSIREGVLSSLLNDFFTIRNEHLVDLNNAINKICTDKDYLEKFAEKFKTLESLLKGKPSAKFSYTDVNGKTVNLDDFAGKFVYIDVWATWCSPCIGEIPHLKKLEEDYHDKNIVFVSISVDNKNAYDKWKTMVAEKELKGYQLYADKSWKSDFIRAYQINSIPTFILIDDKGNIISASATRPSNPETRAIFDKLLK